MLVLPSAIDNIFNISRLTVSFKIVSTSFGKLTYRRSQFFKEFFLLFVSPYGIDNIAKLPDTLQSLNIANGTVKNSENIQSTKRETEGGKKRVGQKEL